MIWLIGAGNMASEYVDVLLDLESDIQVIGRSEERSKKFAQDKGVNVVHGGLDNFLRSQPEVCSVAIVAVDVDDIHDICVQLIDYGVKRILCEKPGGINSKRIKHLCECVDENGVELRLGYNRRYFSSVENLIRMAKEDGGIKSFNFDFTEWSDSIGTLPKSKECKNNWLLANSSHVIDLAFYIGGKPKNISSFVADIGSLEWFDGPTNFSGAGVTDSGALFSYSTNWDAPGRWGLEFYTQKNKYVLRPMEDLHIQRRNTVSLEKLDIDNVLDEKFKPGLYKQVKDFIEGENSKLDTIQEFVPFLDIIEAISVGGACVCELNS